MAGAAGLIVNVPATDIAPPVFTTVTLAVPTVAIRDVGTAAVNCEALTNVVVSEAPFHPTTAPDTKFVPVTVRTKAGPPAAAVLGLRPTPHGPAVVTDVVASGDVFAPSMFPVRSVAIL
jgi:hypothetical protein